MSKSFSKFLALVFILSFAVTSQARLITLIPKPKAPRVKPQDPTPVMDSDGEDGGPTREEIAMMEFQRPYSSCLDELHKAYTEHLPDHPQDFFLQGKHLVVGRGDSVYIYTGNGTQIANGKSCLKDSDANDQKLSDGFAAVIEVLAAQSPSRINLPACAKLEGDRIQKAVQKARHQLVLEGLGGSRTSPASRAQ